MLSWSAWASPPGWPRCAIGLGEALSRAAGLPAYAVSAVAAELRKPLNECISAFLGDVFIYLRQRGTAAQPGEIPQRFLETLQRAQQHKLTPRR